jgi:GLPGLI family protein
MKKILFAATLALLTITTLSAQKDSKKSSFEGTVKYGISFEGSGLPKEAMEMLNGAEAVTYIKGEQRRMDLNMAIQSTTAITDIKNKSIVTLMDIMGQKYLIRISEAELKKEEADAPELSIKYLDETKDIAGYKCKKAEITMKSKEGKEDVVNVYYTEEIPTSEVKAPYKGLKGFPMEYLLNQGGLKMTFTTKSVSKEAVADSKFEIPKEGYKETTMEEFQKTMLQMGGGGQ